MVHIAVIGGGPGGIAFAQQLSKSLSSSSSFSFPFCKVGTILDVQITVFEKREFFFHAPGALRAMVDNSYTPKVLIPFDKVFEGYPNVELKFASVDRIDYDTKTIHYVSNNQEDTLTNMRYDYLVLATGSSSSSPSKPSASITTSKQMMDAFTSTADNIQKSDRILIVGGGVVGIELAGELRYTYPDKKIILLDSHGELLSRQNVPKLREPVKKILLDHDIELHFNERIKRTDKMGINQFGTQTITTESGLELEVDAILWSIGMKPNVELMTDSECISNNRFIKVKPNLEVDSTKEKYQKVYVIGDASNHPTPKLLFWAMQQGQHLAKNLASLIQSNGQTEMTEFTALSSEILVIPFGPEGGISQLPLFGGLVVGNYPTKLIKSKDLMADMFWTMMNQEIPE
ncbi:hypothetical protein CTEN210_00942 [Chaetoceros tenuissimus]|uniref:FAD/NAD(P)-binding domain-containing protein n=1 Tax=Chaetoceros tenuissimus TaxID=426638 RepID=A0AAD3CEP7_9STRA|nr:hypothetical protein CTEN210_00942 [Chaetoceros tenuissimus]